MKKRELEQLLREAGRVAREVEFFVIGSQAVHAYCRRSPTETLRSQECDLYPKLFVIESVGFPWEIAPTFVLVCSRCYTVSERAPAIEEVRKGSFLCFHSTTPSPVVFRIRIINHE